MTRLRLFDGIHRKHADRVDAQRVGFVLHC
jgi:hypothetical protein